MFLGYFPIRHPILSDDHQKTGETLPTWELANQRSVLSGYKRLWKANCFDWAMASSSQTLSHYQRVTMREHQIHKYWVSVKCLHCSTVQHGAVKCRVQVAEKYWKVTSPSSPVSGWTYSSHSWLYTHCQQRTAQQSHICEITEKEQNIFLKSSKASVLSKQWTSTILFMRSKHIE